MSPDPEPPEPSSPPAPPVIGALAADQAVTPITAGLGHHGPFHSHCENCATPLEGPFCHRCGQHDFEFHRSFWHVFLEALENLFHFEGKFFRNIVTLLFQPGRLSADFNAGKRAAQMPPFRLYIFVSVLFFFISFAGTKPQDAVVLPNMDAGARAELEDTLQTIARDNPDQAADVERLRQTLPAATEPAPPRDGTPPDSAFETRLQEMGAYALLHQRELATSFLHAIPKMLLFCLPVFALYLRFLYRKSGLVYLQHLVVAVHFHIFVFLWLLFRNGWADLAALPGWGLEGWVRLACNLWLVLYPCLMLRRLFANSWPKTLAKTALLGGAYAFTLGLGFLLTAALVFLAA
jgi:hypothetical protein